MSVLCAVSVLSSCGGDDPAKKPDATPSASSSHAQDPGAQKTRTCKVEVAVTGAATVSWTGKGTSRTASSGPRATYTATHGKAQISVYSDGQDFTASANVTIGQDTYTTPPADSTGVDARGNGKGAELDADTTGTKGQTAHVTASFDC